MILFNILVHIFNNCVDENNELGMLNLLLYYGLPKDLAREKRCNLAKRKKEKRFSLKNRVLRSSFTSTLNENNKKCKNEFAVTCVSFFFISACFYFEFISSVVILYISWLVTKTVNKNNENPNGMI